MRIGPTVVLFLLLAFRVEATAETSALRPAENVQKGRAAKVKADFSTPRAAVETFFAAAAGRDRDVLSECFASDAPGEFDEIRQKEAQ